MSKRSLISKVLVLCMLLTVFTPLLTAGAEEAYAPWEEKDYSTKEEISWAVWMDDQYDDINQDEFAKLWNERFNVEWDLIGMTAEQWAQLIRIWVNSQDLPDVAQYDYIHADAASYVEQGLVRKLPDDWKTRWPNLAKTYEDTVIGPKLEEVFGGTYFLPRAVFANNKPTDPLVSHQSIFMRRDWLEAAGIEVKPYYTISELLDVARAIKEKDPGNVGSKLVPIGNTVDSLAWIFVYPNSTYSRDGFEYFKDENGVYQWGPAQPETLQGLKYYEQAYREGLLHPEFFNYTGSEWQENFYVAGISAMCQAPGMAQVGLRFANNLEANLGVKAEDWLQLSFCIGDDGKYHQPEELNFFATLIFSPSMSEEKFERILDVLDYACTDQGQYEIRMGIKGVDWDLDENGELVNLMAEDETVLDKYYCVRPFYHNMIIASDDFGLINPTYPQLFRDMSYNMYQEKIQLTDEISLGRTDWDAYFYDSDAKRRAVFNLAEEYAQLVVADGDMETKWNAWVEEKMQYVQPVLDELNALNK